MPYIIAPLSDVKGLNNYPEYIDAMRALQQAAFARAASLWEGFTPGGILPGQNQFGIGPFRKNDQAGDTTDSANSGSYTYRKNYTTASAWTDAFRYTVRVDEIHAFAGFLIDAPTLNLIQFRMQIGSKIFPVFDIQEAQRYSKFAIILKTDAGSELIADPKTFVLTRVYVETAGFQRVVPLGFELFRRPDLHITET